MAHLEIINLTKEVAITQSNCITVTVASDVTLAASLGVRQNVTEWPSRGVFRRRGLDFGPACEEHSLQKS